MNSLISPISIILAGDGNVIYCSKCKTHYYSVADYNGHLPCG